MFKKILVCLDGSEFAEQILPFAREEAVRFQGRLVLLEVVTVPTVIAPGVPGAPGPAVRTEGMLRHGQRDERMARAYLEQLAEPLRQAGLKVDCVSLIGTPGETIVSYAGQNSVNLITIATHGAGGVKRAVFGSVADFVLRHADIPILLIKPQ